MESLLFVGTTDASGNLTITQRIYHVYRVAKVEWFVGDFAAGVDATLVAVGAGNVVGGALALADRTLLTLTDANVNAWYAVNDAGGGVVADTLRLTVTNGGANKSGGCRVYFDDSVSPNLDVRESWRISTLTFNTADDSDNTFVVPDSTEYQILSVYISLTTTATVGNRQMVVQALDASNNVIMGVRAGLTQPASTTRVYEFAPGMVQDVAFRDTDYASVALPPLMLAGGQKLRVYDKAAVAAAADDMVVNVQIASRSVG